MSAQARECLATIELTWIRAIDYAQQVIRDNLEFSEGDWKLFDSLNQNLIAEIENELQCRTAPFHARQRNPFPEWKAPELNLIVDTLKGYRPPSSTETVELVYEPTKLPKLKGWTQKEYWRFKERRLARY